MQNYSSPIWKFWLAIYNAIDYIYIYISLLYTEVSGLTVILRTAWLIFWKRANVSIFHPKDSKKWLESKYGFNVFSHLIFNDLDQLLTLFLTHFIISFCYSSHFGGCCDPWFHFLPFRSLCVWYQVIKTFPCSYKQKLQNMESH